MKTAILGVVALVGLLILGALGWLAFGHKAIAQSDFETEIMPASHATTTTPPPIAAPAPVPAPALIMPEPAPSADIPVKTSETPVAATTIPPQAVQDANIIPVPEKPAVDTSAIPYNPSGEMSE